MSIEAQLIELQEYTKREGIKIDETFIESKSAKKPGREIFNEMMEAVHESKEPVTLLSWHLTDLPGIAWTVDRLFTS